MHCSPPTTLKRCGGVGFFDSLETINAFRGSEAHRKRVEALSVYVAEVLWERTFTSQQWDTMEHPLAYAVYLRPTPRARYQMMLVCQDPRSAVGQGKRLLDEWRSGGYPDAVWTMRAYGSADSAPLSLPAGDWHMVHDRP